VISAKPWKGPRGSKNATVGQNTVMAYDSLWRSIEFWTLSTGLFLNAYVYGMAASQSALLGGHTFLLLAWPPLWLATGILLGGTAADKIDRLRLLMTQIPHVNIW
jgi:hypothetical protein